MTSFQPINFTAMEAIMLIIHVISSVMNATKMCIKIEQKHHKHQTLTGSYILKWYLCRRH